MWNPLTIPVVALGTVADFTRALAALPRAVVALEKGLDRLESIIEQGDVLLAELREARLRGDDVVAAADRARDEAELVRKLIEQTRPSAERLALFAEPILQASIAAREQLERTQAELAKANQQVERMLEKAQPIERVTGRMGRLGGAFRRNSPAES